MRCLSVFAGIAILIPILICNLGEAKDEHEQGDHMEKNFHFPGEAANVQGTDFNAAHFDDGNGDKEIEKRQDDYSDAGEAKAPHHDGKFTGKIEPTEFKKRFARSSPPPSPESGEFFGHRTKKRSSNDRSRTEDPTEWGEAPRTRSRRDISREGDEEIPQHRRFARRIFDWSDEERLTRDPYGIKFGKYDWPLVLANDELGSEENTQIFDFEHDSEEFQPRQEDLEQQQREWRYNEMGIEYHLPPGDA